MSAGHSEHIASPPRRFTVATYNVHHATGSDGRNDLERVARTIGGLGADVVALQELDVGWERSAGADQPADLARSLGMSVSFHPTIERPDGSAYGLAVAARDEIEAHLEPLPRRSDEEPRGVIVARWRGVTLLVTHLSRDRRARADQIEALAARAAEIEGPLIVAGDLNTSLRHLRPLMARGLAGGRAAPTIPVGWPRVQIDHILAGGGLRVRSVRSVRSRASDHRPLVAAIEFLPRG